MFVSEARFASGIAVSEAYNPEIESTVQFKKRYSEYDIHIETENYERFLNKVDAVYIASTNETHCGYAKQALACGKSVLCEKPLAFTKKESMVWHQKNVLF